jgi:hypothetical protein
MKTKMALALISSIFFYCSILAADAAAGSGQHPKFGDYQTKGFLSDYSKLELRADTEDTFFFQDPNTDISQYKKLMVERIKVWLKEDAAYKGIDPAEIKELTDYFHNAIVEAVEGQYPIVREPGPDVLRLRIAMTDLVPTKPSASLITLVVPFLWVAEAGSGVVTDEAGSTPFVGEVTIELEALDSQSNRQIAAFIERKIGLKYHWNKGVKTGVTDYLKAYSTWAYTKQAMDHWAQAIRDHLDKAHGIAPAKN